MPSPARRFEKRPSLDNLVERVDAQPPGEITGDTIPTGFGSLDKLLGGGLRRRDLILLGGDIGSGKSALALGIALRVAQQSVGVAYLSGEMNEERLMERALAIEGKVAVDELRAAKLNDQTRAGVGAAAVRLRGLPLSLLALAGDDFATVFEQLDPLRQVGLVVVDYLQLVPPPKARTTQDEDTALVLRHLKALALARQVALLVVAQLPSFQTGRDAKRPTLDDYGVMGAPKQHADVILSIFREEMYNPGGGVDGATDEEVTYEGYGPGGAALLIQATTDNPNRTVAEIRNVFQRHGANLAASNAVAWMFDRKGQIVVDGKASEDATMEVALDAGADDMEKEGDIYLITTPPAQLHAIDQALRSKKLPVQSAEIAMVPKNTVKVEGSDAKRLLQLVEGLEEMDDVAKVFSNFDIDAEAMAAVTG